MSSQFARVYAAQALGLRGELVTVEVDIARGLHHFAIVGLANKSVDEARDRVNAALRNSGYASPRRENQKTTISLAPAEVRKQGSHYDVAIAVGYLLARGEVNLEHPEEYLFLGELALNGDVLPITGVLALVHAAQRSGIKYAMVPLSNASEASHIKGITIYGIDNLNQVIKHLDHDDDFSIPEHVYVPNQDETRGRDQVKNDHICLSDIKGQDLAKHAIEIAASGGHNIALYGPPGTGKTMLAKALCGLLPRLRQDDALEVTAIHSIAGKLHKPLIEEAPFRSPHHTASYASIIGGGTHPMPGEVTLAHRGVLFLDEFPEFDKKVIETLRQPLEDGLITISRAQGSAVFPTQFLLVVALNPCPCGFAGSPVKTCSCSIFARERYQQKISGPIADRIDMWVPVEHIDYRILSADMTRKKESPSSQRLTSGEVRSRIQENREKQYQRQNKLNYYLTPRELDHLLMDDDARNTLQTASEALKLSPRSFHKCIKLARTIADMSNQEQITNEHILESLQYRPPRWIVA